MDDDYDHYTWGTSMPDDSMTQPTRTHAFTGRYAEDGCLSARCSCGAHLRHVTGGAAIAPHPVAPTIARRWFAMHVKVTEGGTGS